jgi:hypothetical protein
MGLKQQRGVLEPKIPGLIPQPLWTARDDLMVGRPFKATNSIVGAADMTNLDAEFWQQDPFQVIHDSCWTDDQLLIPNHCRASPKWAVRKNTTKKFSPKIEKVGLGSLDSAATGISVTKSMIQSDRPSVDECHFGAGIGTSI